MDIPFALILDICVAALLVVTISYAVTLNKRLGTLRGDREELQKLALSFGDATARAEDSIMQLRANTEVLQERIKRAEALREDLVFLMDRGNGTADRLETLVRSARDDVGVTPGPTSARPQTPAPAQGNASGNAPGNAPGNTSAAHAPTGMNDEPKSPAAPRSAPAADIDERPAPDAASDAERELLKALRSAG